MKNTLSSLTPFLALLLGYWFFIQFVTNSISRNALINYLIHLLPLFLVLTFATLLYFGYKTRKKIIKQFLGIDRNVWFWLIAILFLGLFVRLVTPQTHRVYFDEDIYENIAQNILNSGRSILCNTGTPTSCEEYILNKQPNAFPFLLSIVFAIFGVKEHAAFGMNVIIGTATIALVFLVTYLLFKKEKIALYASLIFSVIPMHIIWSTTVASEPSLTFFSLLTIFIFLIFIKEKKRDLLYLLAAVFTFTLQVRYEAVVMGIVLLMGFFFLKKNPKTIFIKHRDSLLFALLIVLFLAGPHFVHLSHANKTDSWGASGEKLSLQYVKHNFSTNFMFFFENTRHPVVFTVISLIGFLVGMKVYKRETLFVLVWFSAFFGVYLLFYAGSFNFGVDVRYSLSMFPAFAVLAGIGLLVIESFLKSFTKEFHAVAIVVMIVLISFYFFIPYVTTIWRESFEGRESHDFSMFVAETRIDDDCYILTHVPSMYMISGKKALQTWNCRNKEVMKKIFSKTDCVVFDEGYWCQIEPYKSEVCSCLHNDYTLIPIETHDVKGSRHVYTFYNVYPK
jgi:4-amino-4-deoxy-L-arabinose transferase-like glycosyltransferase